MADIHSVNGVPALFLPHMPNWRVPVEREFAYKTEIFTSFEGDEQRRALRSTPRREINYTVTLTGDARKDFFNRMSGYQRNLLLIADPILSVRIQGAMPGLASEVMVESVPYWMQDEGRVALEYRGRVEYRRITALVGQQLSFDSVTATSWPEGTRVRPVYPARLLNGLNNRVPTSITSEAMLNFSVEPLYPIALPDVAPQEVYGGLEVFLRKPNWATALSVEIEAVLEQLDFDRGARTVIAPTEFSPRMQKMTYLSRNMAEADEIEAFFHRMKGRRGTFYMPSGTKDFVLAEDIEAGSYRMAIRASDAAMLLDEDPAYRTIVLFDRTGNRHYNRIEDYQLFMGGWGLDYGLSYGLSQEFVVDADPIVVFTLTEPWAANIAASNVRMASWLLACRLGSDIITFTHETAEVMQHQMTVMQIKDYEPASRARAGYGLSYGYFYGGAA